jgi:3-phenylpropionate/trans-cinnamate dioxygenase ferredoxin reductase subunit
MSEEHCVIIGASHAAANLASGLRQEGWEGRITLVGDESLPPYHRPPLSKNCLAAADAQAPLIRPEAFYAEHRIELCLGQRAIVIDREKQQIVREKGDSLSYSHLALTTGALPRRVDIPGAWLAGVHYLRNMADVAAIHADLEGAASAVIVGGGYIGLEVAASLRAAGLRVTVLEAMPRVLQRVTAPEVSAFFTRLHSEEGVDIETGTAVSALLGDERLRAVRCEDGREFDADVAIIGIGIHPDTALAEAAGLEVNDGIVVDEFARSSDPAILAAGDCTRHFNPIYQRWMRLESVQNATEQARTAAKTIAGNPTPYRALPWFWSDQFDVKLQIAGLSAGYDRLIVRGDLQTGRSFCAAYLRDGQLIALDAVNRPRDFMAAKRAIVAGCRPDPDALADESVELKALLEG